MLELAQLHQLNDLCLWLMFLSKDQTRTYLIVIAFDISCVVILHIQCLLNPFSQNLKTGCAVFQLFFDDVPLNTHDNNFKYIPRMLHKGQ